MENGKAFAPPPLAKAGNKLEHLQSGEPFTFIGEYVGKPGEHVQLHRDGWDYRFCIVRAWPAALETVFVDRHQPIA